MRDLLLRACRETMPGSVITGAPDAVSALTLCRTEQPDLVILDLGLPDREGLDILDDLLASCPRCKVIGISGYNDEFTLHRALQSKLHGFVDKNENTIDQLTAAVRAVMGGERYLSPAARRARVSLRNDPSAFNKILTSREQELLRMFGRGLSNEMIAREMSLSELTVRNHRNRIMTKLGLRTSTDLIGYALAKGFSRSSRG